MDARTFLQSLEDRDAGNTIKVLTLLNDWQFDVMVPNGAEIYGCNTGYEDIHMLIRGDRGHDYESAMYETAHFLGLSCIADYYNYITTATQSVLIYANYQLSNDETRFNISFSRDTPVQANPQDIALLVNPKDRSYLYANANALPGDLIKEVGNRFYIYDPESGLYKDPYSGN